MAVDDQAVGGGFLGNLPPNIRLAVIAGAAVILTALVCFFIFSSTNKEEDDGFRTVYKNLPLSEAGNAKDYLEDEFRIPVKLGDGGTTIRVPKDKAEDALVKLAQKGMPGSGEVGYEIFDKMSFISTDFEKRVALQRARDGHLSRLVKRFEGVADARVNIVIPEPTLFSEQQLPTTASVLIEFAGGGGFKEEYVNAIANMIASATPGLKPGNVTIVDNAGQILQEGQEGLYGDSDTKKSMRELQEKARMKRLMEQQMENKVILMLSKVVGEGKVQASVELDINFDKAQVRTRKHDPVLVDDPTDPNKKVPSKVAERISKDGQKEKKVDGAVQPNTPGTEEKENNRENVQNTYNYNNIEELISKETGIINNKSISVQYELPAVEEGADTAEGGPAPLTDADVTAMVKAAVNFQEPAQNAPGDIINVRQVKFDTAKFDKLKGEMEKARQGTPWWMYVLIALGGLVIGAGVAGAILGKKKAAAGAEQFGAMAGAPQYAAIPGPPGMPGAEGLPGAAAGAPGLPAGAPGVPAPAVQSQEVSRAPIMPPTPDNPFGFLQGVTPQTVAQLLSTERLPTLVAVLAQLDPSQAEDVIHLLNPEIQNEVRTRLAQNPVLPPMTQKMVSQSLKKRLASMSSGVV